MRFATGQQDLLPSVANIRTIPAVIMELAAQSGMWVQGGWDQPALGEIHRFLISVFTAGTKQSQKYYPSINGAFTEGFAV